MPAAELIRLRQQINQLILAFNEPALFMRRLREILDMYANHAYRPGQAVQPQTLLPSYRVPQLVMRQLALELGKTSQELPLLALEIVDALWGDAYLEPRTLACMLLGAIPIEAAGDGVLARLQAWSRPEENLRVITLLMEHGTLQIRRRTPDRLLNLITIWLSDANIAQQVVGLQAVVVLAQDRSFQNLPALYSLIGPALQNAQVRLQVDLLIALRALILRSPAETAYFLRQSLSLSTNTNTARLIRRCLADFPPEQQVSLRTALQAKTNQ